MISWQPITTNTVKINLPTFYNLFSQIIDRPIINGAETKTKYQKISYNDCSYRLSSLIGLFNNDFSLIDEFFEDKFWVDMFEYLATNQKAAGDAIDFNEIKNRCLSILNTCKINLGDKTQTYLNEENLCLGLKNTVTELCDNNVFFKGYTIKCPVCYSTFWYRVNEIAETIKCKGCLKFFSIPVELNFSYKFNDLVKNSMYQNLKDRDGNLTVLRTLAYLKSTAKFSFEYTPQINIYDNLHSNKPCGDIDIVCLIDGKLVIGESKHSSTLFKEENNKCLQNLVDISKEIYPDEIILACYEDTRGGLQKAVISLNRLFNKWEYTPKITAHLLYKPDYSKISDESYRYFYY